MSRARFFCYARAVLRPAFAPLLLVGFATACASNSFRSPAFTAQRAPAPAYTTTVVKCLAKAHASSDAVSDALVATLRERAKVIDVRAEERVQLCGELATDDAVSTWSTSWDTGKVIAAPLVRALAKANGAGCVLVPVVRTVDVCNDASCEETQVDVSLFLFGAEGDLLWKGATKVSATGDGVLPQRAAELANKLIADVPAVFAR